MRQVVLHLCFSSITGIKTDLRGLKISRNNIFCKIERELLRCVIKSVFSKVKLQSSFFFHSPKKVGGGARAYSPPTTPTALQFTTKVTFI